MAWKALDRITPAADDAAEALLDTEVFISKIRGKEFEFNGVTLIPTYHPAYLLRNPSAKKEVWIDLKKIIKILSLK